MKRNRYGEWKGGPDPLAPPYDVRAAVDSVGRDVLGGRSLREALRDLLRRGPSGRRGLDDLAARARRMRREAMRRGDLDGAVTRAQHNEYVADHYFSAYPEATATMVLQALELEPRLAALRDRAADLTPAEFAEEWHRLLTEVQHCL